MTQGEVKTQVRQFYDRIGWQMDGELYQNARYEDLRPVSAEYLHRCHLRVKRHIKPNGTYLLDGGSGPIQYPEYLLYSEGYTYRVCADLSIVALKEARRRIGTHGLFVVTDIANLPFKAGAFDGAVTLHTFHHLPQPEQMKAYREVYRVLAPESSAVVVNGWTDSSLMRQLKPLMTGSEWVGGMILRLRKGKQTHKSPEAGKEQDPAPRPNGTYIHKLNAEGLRRELAAEMDLDIRVWRSVNVRFLRSVIHKASVGKLILKLLFALEESFPSFFGENGQYPLIVLRKPG